MVGVDSQQLVRLGGIEQIKRIQFQLLIHYEGLEVVAVRVKDAR